MTESTPVASATSIMIVAGGLVGLGTVLKDSLLLGVLGGGSR